MNRLSFRHLLVLGSLLLGGCIEPFTPEVPNAAQTYLVVDGFINSQGSTSIKLSRTLSLAATGSAPAETKATVYILDDLGARYSLTESATSGTYTSPTQTLNPARKYQVRVTTAKGRQYASDLEVVKTTPPIDNVTWKYENQGVQLYLNTHDPSNNTRYYRWEYSETWAFTSAYRATQQYLPAVHKIRPSTIDTYNCWRTQTSTSIIQGNTAGLSLDVMADAKLLFWPLPNERLGSKYSILVRQMGQSQAEYDYWELMRKNTESLGTVNDPLPTQLTGNVHCLTDASEPVMGYVGVHSVVEKRIFIDRSEFPQGLLLFADPLSGLCTLTDVPKELPATTDRPIAIPDNALQIFRGGTLVPIMVNALFGDTIYTASSPQCVDCRLRGTNVKPSFWP